MTPDGGVAGSPLSTPWAGPDLLERRPRTQPGEAAGTRGYLPVTWPLVVLFVAFPIWWLLGVAAFIWPVVAVLMVMAMAQRRMVMAPLAITLWFAFLSWVLLSGLQLNGATRILTFGYRLSLYAAAGVLFLYVYNLPRSQWVKDRVLRILVIFWIIVVAGGYAGLLVGSHTFTPPLFHLIPHALRNKAFIQELVLPVFAQGQSFAAHGLSRPAAPFAYTNEWGGNIATLTMVAIAAAVAARPGRRRSLIVIVLAASLVPMVASLNRGMFLSLGLGIVYVAVRLAIRGQVGKVGAVLAAATVAAAIVALTPLGSLVTSSFSSTHGHSNATRLSLYEQAGAGANSSPVFGYGAPQSAVGQTTTGAPTTGPATAGQIAALHGHAATESAAAASTASAGAPAIGTQGQLWMILYSSGYPALVFFVGFFLVVLWQTRHARGTAGLWLHAAPLVALLQIAVYGWLPAELQVVMVTAALAYHHCQRTADGARPGSRIHAAVIPAWPARSRAAGPSDPPVSAL